MQASTRGWCGCLFVCRIAIRELSAYTPAAIDGHRLGRRSVPRAERDIGVGRDVDAALAEVLDHGGRQDRSLLRCSWGLGVLGDDEHSKKHHHKTAIRTARHWFNLLLNSK
jgi:hypothetical protein